MINIKTKNEKIKSMFEQVLQEIKRDDICNINVDIIVLESNVEYLKYFYNIRNFFENVYYMNVNSNILAFSCEHYDKIFILSHRYDLTDSRERLELIRTLIHEMQHQYQRQKTPMWYSMAKRVEMVNKVRLHKLLDREISPLEKDANDTANHIMNKNIDKFLEIIRDGDNING
jgi:hypothetical protein